MRQFNDTMQEIYAATPSELRSARPGRSSRFGPIAPENGAAAGVPLRLAYRSPYASVEVFDYLGSRAITGIEEIVGERGSRVYRRTLRLPGGAGIAEVGEQPGAGGWLECRLHLADLRDLTTATQRMRRLFDLDADPCAVAERLGADPALAPLVAARPGLRAPGTADPHELAVRAVLGDRALGDALVASYGEPLCEPSGTLTHLFPQADDLAAAGLSQLNMPDERRATLRTLTAALAEGTIALDPGTDRDESERRLLALPGISPRTAGYIRMRALGDPDVLLPGDAAVQAGMRRTGSTTADAEGWRPWSSYAMHHFWNAMSTHRTLPRTYWNGSGRRDAS